MVEQTIPYKNCTSCYRDKPLTEYYITRRKKGFQSRCKECDSARKRTDYFPKLRSLKVNLCPLVSKFCIKCKAAKIHSDFYPSKQNRDGLDTYCKECRKQDAHNFYATPEGKLKIKTATATYAKTDKAKAQQKRYRQVYERSDEVRQRKREYNRSRHKKEDVKIKIRNWRLKTRFGLTSQQYEDMLRSQSNGCAICGWQHSEKRKLAVDHDHVTGKVRGLLCIQCNTGLGSFRDDPSVLDKAKQYLLANLT